AHHKLDCPTENHDFNMRIQQFPCPEIKGNPFMIQDHRSEQESNTHVNERRFYHPDAEFWHDYRSLIRPHVLKINNQPAPSRSIEAKANIHAKPVLRTSLSPDIRIPGSPMERRIKPTLSKISTAHPMRSLPRGFSRLSFGNIQ